MVKINDGNRGRPVYDITKDQLEYLVDLSFTGTEMAKLLQVSHSTIKRRLRFYGLSTTEQYSSICDDDLDQLLQPIIEENPHLGYRAFTDDQKDLASVHILQENNFNQKNIQFDISSLPRNIDVSLAEIVTQQNNADKMSKKIPDVTEDYNIKDVTKDFQAFYGSGTTLFEVGLDKEIWKHANMNGQLVLFVNVNKTQLASLRLRHRRNVRDFLEEQDLSVITTDSFCSVES
ncbi:unnamed protein product [Mytilus coruscus]|uniref:Uncharacterized protein n=1 Tax=Mytilus coruscus TaxID=42192 RepID=A0A6J8BQA2_MYTCO|nr:unnamed protein product [Mytilus coruscus]